MSIRDVAGKYIPGLARRSRLSSDQALAILPIHNTTVVWTRTEDGEILLKVPRRSDRIGNALARLFRLPDHKDILLDEVGASVWELCDGQHDIRTIVAEMGAKYKLNRREAEVSVTTYIKTLGERKLIGLLQRGGKPRGKR
jgi:hypothetical protein